MRTSALVRRCLLVCVSLAATVPVAAAAPIVETSDRLEINWSNLKLRYYGEASATDALAGDGFKAAEKHAWQNGLTYATEAVRELHAKTYGTLQSDPDKLADEARQAAHRFTASSTSYDTTYYGDGTVRVHLESQLPQALATSAIHFHQKDANEPAMTQYTGLVLAADKSVKPTAIYQVVDETGAVLFDVKDMAQEAFQRHLMGRWYRRPTTAELADAVGQRPVTLAVVAAGDGHFVAKRADWEQALEGQRSLLVNGLVAISLP